PGSWIWGLSNVRRVLFGLPALLGEPEVILCEGEKDVVNARGKLSLVATTAGSAADWSDSSGPEYAALLKRCGVERVVITPHRDAAGQAMAVHAARDCHQVGLVVTVLNLPGLAPGGDLSDWIAAGGDRATFDELAANVP